MKGGQQKLSTTTELVIDSYTAIRFIQIIFVHIFEAKYFSKAPNFWTHYDATNSLNVQDNLISVFDFIFEWLFTAIEHTLKTPSVSQKLSLIKKNISTIIIINYISSYVDWLIPQRIVKNVPKLAMCVPAASSKCWVGRKTCLDSAQSNSAFVTWGAVTNVTSLPEHLLTVCTGLYCRPAPSHEFCLAILWSVGVALILNQNCLNLLIFVSPKVEFCSK